MSSIIVSMLACLGLALTPIAQPHAHIHGDHGDVFVHGGHGHHVEFAPLDFHDDHHEHGHDNGHEYEANGDEQDASIIVDDPLLSAHAHIVHLDSTVMQPQWPAPAKVSSAVHTRSLDPPLIRTTVVFHPPVERLALSQPHLYPPLRGPPRFSHG